MKRKEKLKGNETLVNKLQVIKSVNFFFDSPPRPQTHAHTRTYTHTHTHTHTLACIGLLRFGAFEFHR